MLRAILMLVTVLAAALALPGVAGAQIETFPATEYVVNYFNNAHTDAPDATLRIAYGRSFLPVEGPLGDVCAMIYVFAANQELKECCGCKVTPNGLLTLSVNNDLTSNPVTPGIPTEGTILTAATIPTVTKGPPGSSPECDPGGVLLTTFEERLVTWITHFHSASGKAPFLITETAPIDELSSETVVRIAALKCANITSADPNLGDGLCQCAEEKKATASTATALGGGLLP